MDNSTNSSINNNKFRNSKKLKIIAVNVNSIITNQRRASLTSMTKKEKPDLILLGETKMNPFHKFSLKHYTIVRKDRPNAKQGGGTAILISRNLKFKEIQLQCQRTNQILETSIIRLNLPNQDKLFIISAYATCISKADFIGELHKIFKELHLDNQENYFILAGDLNAKHINWQNTVNNPRGIALQNWLDRNDIVFKSKLYSSELPSYPRGNSFLDLCIADCRLKIDTTDGSLLRTLSYDSDHNAIEIVFTKDSDSGIDLEQYQEAVMLNFRRTDWSEFKEYLRVHSDVLVPSDRNLSNREIDEYLEQLDKCILGAIKKVVPKIKPRNTTDSYSNPTIERLMRQKSKLLTQLNNMYRKFKTHDTQTLNDIKTQLKRTKEILKEQYKQSISNYWTNKIKNIPSKDPLNMFPQVNQIFRAKTRLSIPNLTIDPSNVNLLANANINKDTLQQDRAGNYIIQDNKHKLDVIGAHFANTHTQNSDMGDEVLTRIVLEETNKLKDEMQKDEEISKTITEFSHTNSAHKPKNEEDVFFTSYAAMKKIIHTMNSKKSSGIDNIPNIALKHMPYNMIWCYTVLFNNALNNLYFPEKWKKAKVIALQKKDNDFYPKNFRPISLLPNISKIFEVAVNNAISSFCHKRAIIPESQFGFKYRHSTTHAVNKLTSDVCWALNDKKCVAACLVDLEKAFDTVWTEGLIFKLLKKGFPKHLIKIVWKMIRGKSFIVTNGAENSTREYVVENGLQQGTVNSPILFNIYTSDLLELFERDELEGQALAFADDLIIYLSGKKPESLKICLQNVFLKIKKYYNSWKLKINSNKCETILFRDRLLLASRNIKQNWKNFCIKDAEIQGETIKHKTTVKYLGINLDQHLSYTIHNQIQLEKSKKTFMKIKRLFYCKHLNSEIKILCYQLLVRPILTYGCPIWYNISAHIMEKMRVFERSCLRACIGKYRNLNLENLHYISNQKLYNNANIKRIDNFIVKLIRNHFANATSIRQNTLICHVNYPNENYYKKTLVTGYVPPEAFTFLDANGYIQSDNNIPIIYHVDRTAGRNKLSYDPSNIYPTQWRYSKAIPIKDSKDNQRADTKKYFWLQQ